MTEARFPDLDGAAVLVTGGGSGIGAALVAGFAAQGARVSYLDLVAGDARGVPDEPLFIPCDVADLAALHDAVAAATDAHGPARILVNNVADDTRHTTLEVDAVRWDAAMAVNLRSYFFASQAVIPAMREAGGGSIVNLSSISYVMGQAGYPLYTAANAGITSLTRSLAREFGADGIRANALGPGWVMTERQRALWATEEAVAAHLERQCLKRTLAPADMVGPALFLASAASGAMTGQFMAVDGGVVTTG
ncbi:SDR family NAD(P)-dependent oxidoreductase [Roseivivax sediminis]|uniref:NAD(P)-dependent dehydrogenase, short-chain alcohol dehydrogenase family n=1 Tax=Roseivivax sediminis TaxID=936889 RepID=A0A1I1VC71_9RHOB|nr:SDR family oxidoreductase [Roseivivax sediminis]SFD80514.1 NAD(P)-dependent dehydrogenase, short-chain alcohol dehydrogenase family [Roseivivax sediminis]